MEKVRFDRFTDHKIIGICTNKIAVGFFSMTSIYIYFCIVIVLLMLDNIISVLFYMSNHDFPINELKK